MLLYLWLYLYLCYIFDIIISLATSGTVLLVGYFAKPRGWSTIHLFGSPQVRSICCNSDGTRMATLDVRPEVTPGDGYDTSLKFWERRAGGATAAKSPLYSVHDEFDVPHRSLSPPSPPLPPPPLPPTFRIFAHACCQKRVLIQENLSPGVWCHSWEGILASLLTPPPSCPFPNPLKI